MYRDNTKRALISTFILAAMLDNANKIPYGAKKSKKGKRRDFQFAKKKKRRKMQKSSRRNNRK